MRVHAQRRGVNRPVGRGEGGAGVPTDDDASAPHPVGNSLGTRRIDIDQGQLLNAECQGGVGDRCPSAAGTEVYHFAQRGIRQSTAETLRAAKPVGVVADALSVAQDHRVHRAQSLGIGAQIVQILDHGLLTGVGNIQAIEPQPLGRPQQVRQCVDHNPNTVRSTSLYS
jgi:hypothetical protein